MKVGFEILLHLLNRLVPRLTSLGLEMFVQKRFV